MLNRVFGGLLAVGLLAGSGALSATPFSGKPVGAILQVRRLLGTELRMSTLFGPTTIISAGPTRWC